MGKEIDRVRSRAALDTVKESPFIAAVALAPVVVVLGVVWWLFGLFPAILLLIAAGVVVVVGGKLLK
jgi:hypothetical protein